MGFPFRKRLGATSSARILFRSFLLPVGDNAYRGGKDAKQFAVWNGDEKKEADVIFLLGAEQKAGKNGYHVDRGTASLKHCNTI
jgi:hypothetical protein